MIRRGNVIRRRCWTLPLAAGILASLRDTGMQKKTSVLFVCTGNICRSPTAEGVFRAMVRRAGLENVIACASAGTHGYHVGEPPDLRTQEVAHRRGYDLSTQRAQKVEPADFNGYDLVLAMDQDNMFF